MKRPSKGFMVKAGVAVAVLLAAVFMGPSAAHAETHRGEATGYITGIEEGGVFWDTTTVYVKSNLASKLEDKYCVTDKDVIYKLHGYANTKTRVVLDFTNHVWFSKGCTFDSDVTIRGARPAPVGD